MLFSNDCRELQSYEVGKISSGIRLTLNFVKTSPTIRHVKRTGGQTDRQT